MYSVAASRANQAAKALENAGDELIAALRAHTGCAGHGAGDDFADQYEPSVSTMLKNAGVLITALYGIGGKFTDTGNSHDQAEKASAAGKSFIAPAGTPTPSVFIPSTGSVRGGTGSLPAGWEFIQGHVTEVWPDADTGKLASLAQAWHDFGDAVSAARTAYFMDVMEGFAGHQSPEISEATSAANQLSQALLQHASDAHSVGHTVTNFHTSVDSKRTTAAGAIGQMLATVGIGLAISMILAPETGGASLAVDGAIDAGDIAYTARTVSTVIEDLVRIARMPWQGITELADVAEGGTSAGSAFGKVGIGMVKNAYKGAVAFGPAAMAIQGMSGEKVNVVSIEVGSIIGLGVGGGVESLGGEIGQALASSGSKAVESSGGAFESGANGLSKAPGGATDPEDEVKTPSESKSSTPELTPPQKLTKQRFELGGKLVGTGAGTTVNLAIQHKLDPQEFVLDSSGDFLGDFASQAEKNGKIVTFIAPVAQAFG